VLSVTNRKTSLLIYENDVSRIKIVGAKTVKKLIIIIIIIIIIQVRREVFYNILIESGIPKILVRLIKMCLPETYCRVRVSKHLSEIFPIRNGLKQGDALSP